MRTGVYRGGGRLTKGHRSEDDHVTEVGSVHLVRVASRSPDARIRRPGTVPASVHVRRLVAGRKLHLGERADTVCARCAQTRAHSRSQNDFAHMQSKPEREHQSRPRGQVGYRSGNHRWIDPIESRNGNEIVAEYVHLSGDGSAGKGQKQSDDRCSTEQHEIAAASGADCDGDQRRNGGGGCPWSKSAA